jgi:hypothetical protein
MGTKFSEEHTGSIFKVGAWVVPENEVSSSKSDYIGESKGGKGRPAGM